MQGEEAERKIRPFPQLKYDIKMAAAMEMEGKR